MKTIRLLYSECVFLAFLQTSFTVSFVVFVTGLDIHRSMFRNMLITLSILASSFSLFMTLGLYFGERLNESVGIVSKKISWRGFNGFFNSSIEVANIDLGNSIIGNIIAWILATVLMLLLSLLFEALLMVSLWIFMGGLYWIFIYP